MGMPASRLKDGFTPGRSDTGFEVRCDDGRVFSLDALTGAELLQVGAKLNLGDMRSMSNEDRIGRIAGAIMCLDTVNKIPTAMLAEYVEPITPERVNEFIAKTRFRPELEPLYTDPAPIEATVSESPAELTEEAAAAEIARIIGQITPKGPAGITREEVMVMIEDEMTKVNRPIVREITVGERPTLTLEGAQHHQFDLVLGLIGRGAHVLMPGEPGSGKTRMAENIADALGLRFEALACAPTTTDTRLFGFIDAKGDVVRTAFRECFEHGGLFLLDEADNAHPGVIAALNMALANGACTFPDGLVKRHDDFRVIAAANTYGHGATALMTTRQEIDAATRTRFRFVEVSTDTDLEANIVGQIASTATATKVLTKVARMRDAAATHKLRVYASMRQTIHLAEDVTAGIDFDTALQMNFRQGLVEDQWTKVTA